MAHDATYSTFTSHVGFHFWWGTHKMKVYRVDVVQRTFPLRKIEKIEFFLV